MSTFRTSGSEIVRRGVVWFLIGGAALLLLIGISSVSWGEQSTTGFLLSVLVGIVVARVLYNVWRVFKIRQHVILFGDKNLSIYTPKGGLAAYPWDQIWFVSICSRWTYFYKIPTLIGIVGKSGNLAMFDLPVMTKDQGYLFLCSLNEALARHHLAVFYLS